MTETQNSALIRIKGDSNLEKLGVCASAVAENISYMSNRPCKKAWYHKSSSEGNFRRMAVPCHYNIRVSFHTYHGTNPYKKDPHKGMSRAVQGDYHDIKRWSQPIRGRRMKEWPVILMKMKNQAFH